MSQESVSKYHGFLHWPSSVWTRAVIMKLSLGAGLTSLLVAVTLSSVALHAKSLKVVGRIRSATRRRHDMVYPERKTGRLAESAPIEVPSEQENALRTESVALYGRVDGLDPWAGSGGSSKAEGRLRSARSAVAIRALFHDP